MASSSSTVISKDVDRASADNTIDFFNDWRVSSRALDNTSTKDFYSNIIGGHLRIHKIQRGRVTCFFTVKPGLQSELIVEASIARSGKNVTAVAVDFKFKESENLVYTSRATFYNTPVAKL
ncbi:hypothetical protein Dsin_026171 [Dipteronia sinensis]|uniref:Uncharacterized protein n=1 Tax=Dipteronia sinensis TaxID=43782 RepID=A0AAD9ZXF2_9ROSI|nr:hypothetical protein Dsin_026171 [Dipteronia sinensis]